MHGRLLPIRNIYFNHQNVGIPPFGGICILHFTAGRSFFSNNFLLLREKKKRISASRTAADSWSLLFIAIMTPALNSFFFHSAGYLFKFLKRLPIYKNSPRAKRKMKFQAVRRTMQLFCPATSPAPYHRSRLLMPNGKHGTRGKRGKAVTVSIGQIVEHVCLCYADNVVDSSNIPVHNVICWQMKMLFLDPLKRLVAWLIRQIISSAYTYHTPPEGLSEVSKLCFFLVFFH